MTDITELAQREKFEAWFKSSFHPDKTGPYIKDQLYFAWKAAGAELVEALEKAQKSNEFLKGQLSELANFNPDWDKLEASYDSWREIAAELLVAKERIAELESRTVKLPKKFKTSMYGTSLYEDLDILKMLTDAGIKWEAE